MARGSEARGRSQTRVNEGLDDVDVIIEGGECFEKYGRSRIDDRGLTGYEDRGRTRSHDDFMFYLLSGGVSAKGWSQRQ